MSSESQLSEEEQAKLEEQFKAVVRFIHLLPKQGPIKPPISEQLETYSLFKQATIGPCNIEKPSLLKIVDRFKWNAWKALGDMSKDDAKRKYVKNFIATSTRNYEKHAKEIPDWLKDEKLAPLQSWAKENYAVFGITHLRTSDGKEHDVFDVAKEIGLDIGDLVAVKAE